MTSITKPPRERRTVKRADASAALGAGLLAGKDVLGKSGQDDSVLRTAEVHALKVEEPKPTQSPEPEEPRSKSDGVPADVQVVEETAPDQRTTLVPGEAKTPENEVGGPIVTLTQGSEEQLVEEVEKAVDNATDDAEMQGSNELEQAVAEVSEETEAIEPEVEPVQEGLVQRDESVEIEIPESEEEDQTLTGHTPIEEVQEEVHDPVAQEVEVAPVQEESVEEEGEPTQTRSLEKKVEDLEGRLEQALRTIWELAKSLSGKIPDDLRFRLANVEKTCAIAFGPHGELAETARAVFDTITMTEVVSTIMDDKWVDMLKSDGPFGRERNMIDQATRLVAAIAEDVSIVVDALKKQNGITKENENDLRNKRVIDGIYSTAAEIEVRANKLAPSKEHQAVLAILHADASDGIDSLIPTINEIFNDEGKMGDFFDNFSAEDGGTFPGPEGVKMLERELKKSKGLTLEDEANPLRTQDALQELTTDAQLVLAKIKPLFDG